eukprot:Sspe_Gene.5515::Locus_1822_Transcript_3_3_Confidence_0.714_Length_1564::g.5515::m.5515/K12393/AP1M; AP-1 complex subunit mu
MASALVVVDMKGKSLITRNYRQDISYSVTDVFVERVIEEEEVNIKPVFEVNGLTFAWVLHNNLYFVLVSKINCNASMLIVYLHKLLEVLQEYMENVTEESIRDNFVVVYELLDEMMDFGYPQFTESKILTSFITQESHRLRLLNDDDDSNAKSLPVAMTGAPGTCPWRPPNLKYRRNEVYLDVIESINLLVNASGETLHSEIQGTLKMKVHLSGMPELKLGLNDKVLLEGTGRKAAKTVDMEDMKFHQCVKLNRFEADRVIYFIPPDGEFDLMSYRLGSRVKPLINIEVQTERRGDSRVDFLLKARSQFKKNSTASGVVIALPVPPDATTPTFQCSAGNVKYAPDQDKALWYIKTFPGGGKEYMCRVSFSLPSIRQQEGVSSKRPITVKFEIPNFTVSGFQVRYLRVTEKSGYESMPWVRYITQSGDYQVRML